jgi:hypothetical protein
MMRKNKVLQWVVLIAFIISSIPNISVSAAYNYSQKAEKSTITGAALNLDNPVHTLYVATDGADTNAGTAGAPFLTLQKAVDVAKVNQSNGDSTKIVIKEGTYTPEDMIRIYDLTPTGNAFIHILGEGNVTFTGAKIWSDWTRNGTSNIYEKEWNYRWGIVNNTYEGRIPQAMQYREIAFVDNKALLPVRSYEALRPGTMFVSETEGKIFICPEEGITDLSTHTVTVSENGAFKNRSNMALGNLIEIENIENFAIENITFEKAAAGVADGVSIRNGVNVILKDCKFNNNAYSGLRFDGITNGTITSCEANNNGGKGIAISGGKNLIVENTTTNGNNWFGYPYGWLQWDSAAIKFFRGHGIRVINHTSIGNFCEGIWADTDIINMYIENSTIKGNKNFGLWIEANVGPVFIEGGIVEGNKNFGLYNSSTENLFVDAVTFKANGGEIGIGDFNKLGRGPLVSDPVWAGDYGNTFGNFETGEGFVSHAVDMSVTNCTFIGEDLNKTPIYNYIKNDDKSSYLPWMNSLTASNNHYSHYDSAKAFYVATSDTEGSLVDFVAWQAATGQDSDSSFSNEGVSYTTVLPPSGVTSADVTPAIGQHVIQASKTVTPPVIDGVEDAIWSSTTSVSSDIEFENQDKAKGVVNSKGVAKLLWDDTYLYFIVTVDDADPTRNTGSNWQCDNVEVFLDQNYGRTTSYEGDDGQYRIGFDGEKSGKTLTWDLSDFDAHAAKVNDMNYVVEGRIKVKNVSMIEGRVMGFDYQVADERSVAGVAARRGIQMWNDETANGYNSTTNWGYLELVDVAQDVATIPKPIVPDQVTTDVPNVLELGATHSIQTQITMNNGHVLTPEEMEEATIIYGSSNKAALTINADGLMTSVASGITMVSVRVVYDGNSKTYLKKVIVPGTLSAFNYMDISPQAGVVQDYSGTITFYPYGCEWMTSGAELIFYGVDFGEADASKPYLNYKIQGHAIGQEMAGGKIEFRIDSPESSPIGAVVIKDTSVKQDTTVDDWNYNNSQLMKATMTQNVTGKHTLYMKFVGAPGNEMHANLRMGKFYWGNFERSAVAIAAPATPVEVMKELFLVDFSDETLKEYGTHNIMNGENQVAVLKLNASGSTGDEVKITDGALHISKDNGPAAVEYGQMQLALQDIEVPTTDRVVLEYDMQVNNWTMEAKSQDFPGISFEKPDGSNVRSLLIMEMANGLGGGFAPNYSAWQEMNYSLPANQNRMIHYKYNFDMKTGKYTVEKDGSAWVSNGVLHDNDVSFAPNTIKELVFKIQKSSSDVKQEVLFDNFKLSYLTYEMVTTTYEVGVMNGSGDGSYEPNQLVSITADAPMNGKRFKEWVVRSGGAVLADPSIATTEFIMPQNAVQVEAIYENVVEVLPDQIETKELFNLTFDDDLITSAGTYPIGPDGAYGQLVINTPEGTTVTCSTPGAIRLEGKGITFVLDQLNIPDTNKIRWSYDWKVIEGFNGAGQDSYASFPKVEFQTNSGMKTGSEIWLKHNELLLRSLKPDKSDVWYEAFAMGNQVNSILNTVYDFNMDAGTYQLIMKGHQFGYGTNDIWLAENGSGTEFIPQALKKISFKTGAGEDETNQIIEMDNIKIEYEAISHSLQIEQGEGTGYYLAGQTATIKANAAPEGKHFDKWNVIYGTVEGMNLTMPETTITMPDMPIVIQASYKNNEAQPPTPPTPTTPTPTLVPTPTPTLVPTPTPAAVLNEAGGLEVELKLTQSDLNKSHGKLTIPVTNDVISQMANKEVKKVNINLQVPNKLFEDNNKGQMAELTLNAAAMEAAKAAGKELTITAKDETGKERFTWSFDAAKAAASGKEMTDVNLSIGVHPLEEDTSLMNNLKNNAGVILNFGHEGSLPIAANVKVYVGAVEGINPGSRIYLYHYNHETGKLETLPYSSNYVVDQEGYISINIVHCSDYVTLTKKAAADQITSLTDQIMVTPVKSTLYKSDSMNTTMIKVELPETLELVKTLSDSTSSDAIGAVTAAYSSSNKKVATVDQSGKITAVGVGKAIITTKITLYSNKMKLVKTEITVKAPSVQFSSSRTSMKVGESFTFIAKIYGLNTQKVMWKTTQKSVIVIDKKTGKAVAKSKGTDYVVVTVGDVTKKVKVVVN